MRVMTLQSGSNGNATYVEADGVRLLVDAGIAGIQVQQRLATQGIDAGDVDALLISHDHSDHVRAMGICHRKFQIPVYVTEPTLMAARRRVRLGMVDDLRTFASGDVLELGGVKVETIPTPHDSADGVGFIIDDGQRRLGILTDLGHVFAGLRDALLSLDAVLLESNYDPQLLTTGPYPAFLQQRIRGPGGHLSNDEAAGLLDAAFGNRLQWACLAHLSEQNNDPQLAIDTHREILGHHHTVYVASRYEPSQLLEV